MKKHRLVFLFLAFWGLFFFSSNKTQASHTAGMELFYRHINGNTYEFTMTFYRNCLGGSATAPTVIPLMARSATLGFSNRAAGTLIMIPGSGLQPMNIYNCTYAALCYEEYVYRGQVNLNVVNPANPYALDWIFYYELCCRPGGAAAPENITSGSQYVECSLNNLDFPSGNSSPFWHNSKPNFPGHTGDTVINYLMRTVCEGNYYSFDMSTTEYDGDSMTYSFFWPQDNAGNPAAYINGYCFTGCVQSQMPTLSPFYPLYMNPLTGVIPLLPGSPLTTGIFVLGIEATEWRYDTIVSGGAFTRIAKKIGYVRRDFTVWVDDSLTCRKDSAHPKDVVVTQGGGDTVVNVFFHSGKTGDPNTLIRCASLSPDGSEFRVIDSTGYIAPFDTTVRSIGVNRAVWDCNLANTSLTNKVTLHLSEPLKCQEYWVLLKKGSDLDVIESECGFLEPEFSAGRLIVLKKVQVSLDTAQVLTVCLPTDDPFPKFIASSTDSASFPLHYYWTFNGDTVNGQSVPYMWGRQDGKYKVMVRDPYNCTGEDSVQVYFNETPDFRFDGPLYCDKYGELPSLPEFVVAPGDPDVVKWEWHTSLGLIGEGDTLREPQLLEGIIYILKGYTDSTPGIERCVGEVEFLYNRENFPPQDPLWVKFEEDPFSMCLSQTDTGRLKVWEDGVRKKFEPLEIQWYYYGLPVPGEKLSRLVQDSGYYLIHVTDSLGCWGRDTVHVTFAEMMEAADLPCRIEGEYGYFDFEWPESARPFITENQVSLDGGNTWIQASGGSNHVLFDIRKQRQILGRGKVANGCEYTEVSLSDPCPDDVFPPNVITPNGDGVNDHFIVRGLDLFERSEIEIFDRWGHRVYLSDDYRNNWDGEGHPEGTYFYVLRVDDPDKTVHRGALTLLR